MGPPPSESEVDEAVSPLPSPAPNIDPEVVTPTNTSPIVYTAQEGADTLRQHQPCQRNKWPEAIWECYRNNKLKLVQLNKFNWGFYALIFGPHNMPPMAQKMSKKQMRLNYKKYYQRLQDTVYVDLQNVKVEEQYPKVSEI